MLPDEKHSIFLSSGEPCYCFNYALSCLGCMAKMNSLTMIVCEEDSL
jgi:hypothetical protein